MIKEVTVAIIGRDKKIIPITGGTTLQGLVDLIKDDYDLEGMQARVNNCDVLMTRELNDKDYVSFAPMSKGNQSSVTVMCMGRETKTIAVENGCNVETAIRIAGMDPTGMEARLDGNAVAMTAAVPYDSAQHNIIISQMSKGNE